MSRELASRVLSTGLAQFGHTDISVTIAAESNSGWLSLSPSAPYKGAIVYWITYEDIPAGTIQATWAHSGYTAGTLTVSFDEMQHGVSMWLYLTEQDTLRYHLANLDYQSRTVKITLWHLNVLTLKEMDLIRLVVWENTAPASMFAAIDEGFFKPLSNLKANTLDKFKKLRFGKWAGPGS